MVLQAISAIGTVLKLAANTAVFIFLIWSVYFATATNFGFWRGIIAFVALTMFSGLVGMFPFGTTLAPILFEWWWHDVPFWKFSTAAWSVTALSMVANILALIGILGSQGESPLPRPGRKWLKGTLPVLVLMALFLVVWRYPVQTSFAGPAEEEVHAAFEWFCLSHLGRRELIPSLFEQIGVTPLPDDKARPLLAPQKGVAWLMDGDQSKFIVMLTEQGVCSISGPRVNGEEAAELFKANIRHRKLGTERIGSQVQDLFAVTFPDPYGGPDGHAIVMLTRSNLASIGGIFLTTLPEQLAREAGINVPEWP